MLQKHIRRNVYSNVVSAFSFENTLRFIWYLASCEMMYDYSGIYIYICHSCRSIFSISTCYLQHSNAFQVAWKILERKVTDGFSGSLANFESTLAETEKIRVKTQKMNQHMYWKMLFIRWTTQPLIRERQLNTHFFYFWYPTTFFNRYSTCFTSRILHSN